MGMHEDAPSKWAAVAADYVAGEWTVAQICTRYGISQKALYEQVKKQGWPLRSAGEQSSADVRKQRRGAKTTRKALIARLYRALEQKMSEFESRLDDETPEAADHERDTRTLNTMVRLFERLSALEEKGRAGKAAAQDDRGGVNADARALREDLARRLERLRTEHGA